MHILPIPSMSPRRNVFITRFMAVYGILCVPPAMLRSASGQDGAAVAARQRTLEFPSERTMGMVFTRAQRADGYDIGKQYDDWKPVAEARGVVSVPFDADVRLDISTYASTDLSGLDGLDPDGVRALLLLRTDVNDDGLKHVSRLTGLRFLDLSQARITDKGIRHLQSLVNLKQIDLDGFRVVKAGFGVGDDGVAVLSKLPNLNRLTIRRSNVTDAGLAHLSGNRSIQALSVGGTHVSDAGLDHLTGMTNLEYLELGNERQDANITDSGMRAVARIRTLKSLDLGGTRVTDAGLAHLGPLSNLERLNITGTRVTTFGLLELQHLTSLKHLRWYGTALRGDAARRLAAIPSLETISANLDLTDADLVHMAKLPNLESLSLSDEGVTDAGASHIAQMKSLKVLWFQRCPITDEGLAQLKRLTSLERMMLSGTQVTDNGLRHLRNHPSLWWLSVRFGEGVLPNKREDSALRHLRSLASLTWLDVGGADLRNEDLSAIGDMRNLETFEVRDLVVDNTGVQHLAGLTSLKKLELDDATITDEGLRSLENLENLEYLTIRGLITDQGLSHLAGLKSLQLLQLGSPFVTDAGIARLKASIPGLSSVNHFAYRLEGVVASVSDKDPILRAGERTPNLVLAEGKETVRHQQDNLEGRPSPPIRATNWLNTGGNELSLADLRGSAVVVHFWDASSRSSVSVATGHVLDRAMVGRRSA